VISVKKRKAGGWRRGRWDLQFQIGEAGRPPLNTNGRMVKGPSIGFLGEECEKQRERSAQAREGSRLYTPLLS
jgi:hypothetical protein